MVTGSEETLPELACLSSFLPPLIFPLLFLSIPPSFLPFCLLPYLSLASRS